MTATTDEELIAKAKYTFVDLMVGDVKRTLDNNILLGSLILSLCAVDTLACFFADKPKGKAISRASAKHFKRFINRFMDNKYEPIAEKLYGAMRGSLVHGYTTKYFLLDDHKPQNHLKKTTLNGKRRQIINLDSFIEDVEKAANKYVEELARDPLLLSNFKVQYEYSGLMSVYDVVIDD